MQLSDLYGDNPLELILLIMLLVYFPYAMYQLYLICYSLWRTDKDIMLKHKPLKEPNNVIVSITTNGMATDVVEKIIKKIEKYGVVSEIFVVKEARDKFTYSCREIVVPEKYKCKNRSRNKMRAMQYGIEALHEMGYGKETYPDEAEREVGVQSVVL